MKVGQKYPKISCCDLVQEDTRLHIEYVMRRLQRAATTLYGTKEYVSRRQKKCIDENIMPNKHTATLCRFIQK